MVFIFNKTIFLKVHKFLSFPYIMQVKNVCGTICSFLCSFHCRFLLYHRVEKFKLSQLLHKLVMAGGLAYALGMNPYFLVLGAYAHSQPSTVCWVRSAYTQSPRLTDRSSGAWACKRKKSF